MNRELVDGMDPMMHDGWYVPCIVLTLKLDTRIKRSWLLDRNQLPENRSWMRCPSLDHGWWCPDLILASLRIAYYTSIHSFLLLLARRSDLQKITKSATFLGDILATFQISPSPLLITMATIYILDRTALATFLVPFLRLGDEF
jgi:hypothetical protein